MTRAQQSPAMDLRVEQVPIDQLRPDPANPRRISDAELDALTRSIREYGLVQPIIARPNDTVIAGHQRLVAAGRLGIDQVPVIWLDIGAEQGRLLGLSLNRIAGDWDEQLLARLLADLQDRVDVGLSGFRDDEITDLLRSMEAREKRERHESFDLDEALEATKKPHTKPGDLWVLGEHQLLCGDATKPDDVARVLSDRQADLCFTDPPYNVAMGDHGGQRRGRRKRRIANDAMDKEAWEAFVRGFATTIIPSVDGAIYLCMSSKELPLVSRVLIEEGGHWSDTIIWVKDRFVLGRADYQRAYEPIWYGWREGVKHVWNGGRDQDDVWRIDRPSESPLHPTMKPLSLIEKAINNSSAAGALVLDPFMGSGSTLIACERTGRISAGIEVDPRYCDVIVARWEAFTELKAERTDA
jgi:DNA modification methylase